jgi:hypothetical protein
MLCENYKCVFIDESGNFGYDFSNSGTSTHFIITAIIVEPNKVKEIDDCISNIRSKYFTGAELKSSSLGKKPDVKRISILRELMVLDFGIYSYVIDKRKINPDSGLSWKKSFIKFTNNLLHLELKRAFQSLKIISDEHGCEDFMIEFQTYFNKQELYLVSNYEFSFENSIDNNLIQLSDFICGTIATGFEENSKSEKYNVFLNFLKDKIYNIEYYPLEYIRYLPKMDVFQKGYYDKEICEYCVRTAINYVIANKDTIEDEIKDKVVVVDYLLYQIQTDNNSKYIISNKLIEQIRKRTGRKYTGHQFKTKIIAKLRDDGVILASGSQGYKIPVNQEELYSYTNHTMQVVYPMLERLRSCRNNILIATSNRFDLMEIEEYKEIRDFFDYVKGDKI